MQGIAVPDLEVRLQHRYLSLVDSHMQVASQLAAGISTLPSVNQAFAATQAAWRFLNNERVSLPILVEPLRAAGRTALAASSAGFALLVHDWCKLSYGHQSKRDRAQLTHEHDIGYELTSALLVDAAEGQPIALMEMHLKTAEGVLSTRAPSPEDVGHLEQVLPTMEASGAWGLSQPLLHVIDREADSVDHYRAWDQAGHYYLIRGDNRSVLHEGQETTLEKVHEKLRENASFRSAGKVQYQGRPARLFVAETLVVLHRPAKKNVGGRRYEKPGPPLALRLIIAEVRADDGQVLASWFLLTNAPADWATAEQLAQCYYYRWRIESFFKLLKSHGHQLEQWQQETGIAIARRLLIAAMACVVVWRLQADDSPPAEELKNVLVRLSGRQIKRGHPPTAPALLAGLHALLAVLALLDQYDLQQLKSLLHQNACGPSG
jgi:hypothetical protein